MCLKLDVRGIEKVIEKFRNATKGTERVINQQLMEFSENVIDTARSQCPVRTGRLRQSLFHQIYPPLGIRLLAQVDYATFVEFGTRYMAPQPFMRPALHQHFSRFLRNTRKYVIEIVEE